MSDPNRDAIARILGSGTYLKWASSPFHLIDARKLAAEWEGTRRPDCGDPFAFGLQELMRLHRPTPTQPPPDPESPLATVWQRDAVFTTVLGNFGEQRHDAWAAGFRVVYVNLLHNPTYLQNNVEHLALFRQEGWAICGWGTYGQGSDAEQDGRDAAALVRQYDLAGWKANGEAWAEWQYAGKTAAFLTGWCAAGAPRPLGWSVLSSDTANFARSYDYVTAMKAPGADIDIQVYGATHPLYTVAAGLGMLAKAPVPVNRTAMTFDITPNGTGPFADYRTWPGPRRLWIGEWAKAPTFAQLAR